MGKSCKQCCVNKTQSHIFSMIPLINSSKNKQTILRMGPLHITFNINGTSWNKNSERYIAQVVKTTFKNIIKQRSD